MNYENPNFKRYDNHLFVSVHPWSGNHGLCTSLSEEQKNTPQDQKYDSLVCSYDHNVMDICDQNADALFTNRQFL